MRYLARKLEIARIVSAIPQHEIDVYDILMAGYQRTALYPIIVRFCLLN